MTIEEPSTEIVTSDEVTREDLAKRPRHEVEYMAGRADYWHKLAQELMRQRDEIAKDLETSLNINREYQGTMIRMFIPDVNFGAVKNMCKKYKMEWTEPGDSPMKIYADGKDITNEPDVFEGQAYDIEGDGYELTATVTKIELVQDDNGEFHFQPVVEIPDDIVLDEEDVEIIKEQLEHGQDG